MAVTAFIILSSNTFFAVLLCPSRSPTRLPSTATIADPASTMPIVTQPPARIRENSQRPMLSVPKGYCALAPWYLFITSVTLGSLGANRNPRKQNRIMAIGIAVERMFHIFFIL